MRTARHVAAAALAALVVAAPRLAEACSVCFGDPDSPQVKGASSAILFLLVVTYAVVGGLGIFFIHLMRRAKGKQPGNGAGGPLRGVQGS